MIDSQHRGFTVWFTGLSGAGKSTIAERLVDILHRRGLSAVELLDGDEVRQNLSKGLGFSKEDRDTNIVRVGYVARLLTRNGAVAITAAISPYREIREQVRKQIPRFLEVFVSAPLEVLIQRDVKGLYKKALAGEIHNFTGISDPYESPDSPEVIVETGTESIEVSVQKVLRALELLRWIPIVETSLPELEEEGVISQLHKVGKLSSEQPLGIKEYRPPGVQPKESLQSHVSTIEPHGGLLVQRFLPEGYRNEIIDRIEKYPTLTLNRRQWSDIKLISNGGYSPLTGFLTEKEYTSIIHTGRLTNGLAWTIPILLLTDREEAEHLTVGQEVLLRDRDGKNLALLHLEEIFQPDKQDLARRVWRTTDLKHPGVKNLFDEGGVALAGSIDIVRLENGSGLAHSQLTPTKTREYFRQQGWKTVVAFQTRNPIHRAHEYIQKVALELVDGLLVHPLVGETKSDDIPADVRMECYKALLEKYYPANRVLLSAMPAAMRYAGPKEAIHHAIIRQNYGCTHFIVGRDHAGVGSYYGTYDAQQIFDEYTKEELAITPLKFEHTFHCTACGGMASERTCPHDTKPRLVLSGTKVRELLQLGLPIPEEFSRPEVIQILRTAYAHAKPLQEIDQ
ncbi:MAG: sulfate adenylyltransferase [Ignavibacteriales bacterium]|nr:sulfate adenylyltransferase [Ignavibacteriales bacterium]